MTGRRHCRGCGTRLCTGFMPDSFSVFDVLSDNAYVIADSNHDYQMIGVGALGRVSEVMPVARA